MKQTLKKISKPIILFLLIVLSSCQKDDLYEIKNDTQNNYTLKEYTFKKANQNSKFNNAFKNVTDKIAKNKIVNKSNIPVVDNNFTIDSTNVKEITSGNYTSYTILIKRAQVDNANFENLIIEVNGNDSIKAYIRKYFPDRKPEYNAIDNSYGFHGTTEIHEIQYNPSVFQPIWSQITCVYTLCCNFGGSEHAAGENCTQANMYWDFICGEATGGSSGYPTGGSGGSGSTPNTNPVLTSPLINLQDPEKTPCETLKNTLNPAKANLKQEIITLQGSIQPSGETGISLTNTNGNYGIINLAPTRTNNIPVNISEFHYGYIHTHPDNTYPIFSFGDLFTLLTIHNAVIDNIPEITVMLVCKDDAGVYQTYSLTINNFAVFRKNMGDKIASTACNSCSTMEKIDLIDKALGIENDKNSNYESRFLENFKDYGISLSRANSGLTNWNTLSRNPLNGNVSSIPCN